MLPPSGEIYHSILLVGIYDTIKRNKAGKSRRVETIRQSCRVRLQIIAQKLIMEKKKRTGFAYDERTIKHFHTNKKYIERPCRVTTPYTMLKDHGLIDQCIQLEPRMATKKELALIHDMPYIESVQSYDSTKEFTACSIPEEWPSFMSDGAYEAASCATGAALNLADAICTGQLDNGVALVRPPGHHSESDESCGFCFFNTVAIMAKHCQNEHNVGKILILDWDIHHGNGIQHAFYEDSNVLYISIHRYDNGDYFPQLKEGNYDSVGSGTGVGFNVNIPWNKDLMGDEEYKMAFDRIVLPIANQFKPDLILVAAGFDAAAADPLGEYIVTTEMFAYMTKHLLAVANQKVALVLEGGYSPITIAKSIEACLEVMLTGQEVKLKTEGVPCKRALQTISSVVLTQSKYWNL